MSGEKSEAQRTYEGRTETGRVRIPAPEIPYQPRDPLHYRPAIGLIGCGGIADKHLAAYRKAGYRVAALCDVNAAKAHDKRERYFPGAVVYSEYGELLKHPEIEVVDVATHPAERAEIIAAALSMRKHVLSQKPFVLDLDEGARLCELADRNAVKLAVNQNGRWAPHFSYARQAVEMGILGALRSAQFSVRWDHNWIAGTPFDAMRHVILYDFAIHWFDMLHCVMRGRRALRVFATLGRSATQSAKPSLQAQVLVEFEGAQAVFSFDGDTRFGQSDETALLGAAGTLVCKGPNLTVQSVTLHTAEGIAQPQLCGTWFEEGFHGTMAELLCAIEEKREPSNSGRDNLATLELCFAAVASANRGVPVAVGSIRKFEE